MIKIRFVSKKVREHEVRREKEEKLVEVEVDSFVERVAKWFAKLLEVVAEALARRRSRSLCARGGGPPPRAPSPSPAVRFP